MLLRLYKDRTGEKMLPETVQGKKDWRDISREGLIRKEEILSAGGTSANAKLKTRGRIKPAPQSQSSERARESQRRPREKGYGRLPGNP